MTDWGKWITITLGAIAFVVLGYLIHSAIYKPPQPKLEIKEKIIYDTVSTVKKVYFTKTDTLTKIVSNGFTTYTDSISGQQQEVDYKIKHTLQNDKEVVSFWEVNIEPRLTTITITVTKDSIRTIVDTKYIQTPFFLNQWFFISLVSWIITVLAIIF